MTEEAPFEVCRCPSCDRPTTATLSQCRHCSAILSGERQGEQAGFLERVFGISTPVGQFGCLGLALAPFIITVGFLTMSGRKEAQAPSTLSMPPLSAAENPKFESERPYEPEPQVKQAASRTYTSSERGRACRATIAALFGRDVGTIKASPIGGDLTRISYRRPDDNKLWKSDCRLDGDSVVWRPVDAFGSDGPGRWRNSEGDETVFFKLEGNTVKLAIQYADGSVTAESFRF